MFNVSSAVIINKTDLLKYIDYDLEKVKNQCLKINPDLEIFEVSSKTGEGMDNWIKWLRSKMKN